MESDANLPGQAERALSEDAKRVLRSRIIAAIQADDEATVKLLSAIRTAGTSRRAWIRKKA